MVPKNKPDYPESIDSGDINIMLMTDDDTNKTQTERLKDAATMLREALGNTADIEVIENMPAIFINPNRISLFLPIFVRETAAQYNFSIEQFNNGEICLTPNKTKNTEN